MECEELIVDKACNRQRVKSLHKEVVRLCVILVKAFGSEVEERRHLATFMVSSEHVDRLWKIQLSSLLHGSLLSANTRARQLPLRRILYPRSLQGTSTYGRWEIMLVTSCLQDCHRLLAFWPCHSIVRASRQLLSQDHGGQANWVPFLTTIRIVTYL